MAQYTPQTTSAAHAETARTALLLGSIRRYGRTELDIHRTSGRAPDQPRTKTWAKAEQEEKECELDRKLREAIPHGINQASTSTIAEPTPQPRPSQWRRAALTTRRQRPRQPATKRL
eukprot:1369512-Alexandrium_andersonii.AAC.1